MDKPPAEDKPPCRRQMVASLLRRTSLPVAEDKPNGRNMRECARRSQGKKAGNLVMGLFSQVADLIAKARGNVVGIAMLFAPPQTPAVALGGRMRTWEDTVRRFS